jgi:hypothetical protein
MTIIIHAALVIVLAVVCLAILAVIATSIMISFVGNYASANSNEDEA